MTDEQLFLDIAIILFATATIIMVWEIAIYQILSVAWILSSMSTFFVALSLLLSINKLKREKEQNKT